MRSGNLYQNNSFPQPNSYPYQNDVTGAPDLGPYMKSSIEIPDVGPEVARTKPLQQVPPGRTSTNGFGRQPIMEPLFENTPEMEPNVGTSKPPSSAGPQRPSYGPGRPTESGYNPTPLQAYTPTEPNRDPYKAPTGYNANQPNRGPHQSRPQYDPEDTYEKPVNRPKNAPNNNNRRPHNKEPLYLPPKDRRPVDEQVDAPLYEPQNKEPRYLPPNDRRPVGEQVDVPVYEPQNKGPQYLPPKGRRPVDEDFDVPVYDKPRHRLPIKDSPLSKYIPPYLPAGMGNPGPPFNVSADDIRYMDEDTQSVISFGTSMDPLVPPSEISSTYSGIPYNRYINSQATSKATSLSTLNDSHETDV